ncbi:DUF6986 family protein [Dietzia sp. B32]|uniref:DUF6986 family protein n=1 Tax=Dietzia sp. B32 TaxID=2915130 RepID=UPI0037BE4CAE
MLAEADARLAAPDAELVARFPGTPVIRQPVHTLYLPAERVHAGIISEVGGVALEAFDEHLPDPAALAGVLAAGDGHPALLSADDAETIHALVRAKLLREPVEDLRIDFEDGFTQRGVAPRDRDRDEDAHVERIVAELTGSTARAALPPFWGLRFGSFDPATRHRGIRTFTRFVLALGRAGAGAGAPDRDELPAHFTQLRPTLPKVTSVDQVLAMVDLCVRLEQACALPERTLRFEIQIETPQSICGPDGSAMVARLIHASARRCIGLHYGTYDYSAACGIAAEYQAMDHPVADHAKAVMQVAAAGTGVALSDGSTNRLPVGDAEAVRAGWRLHARLIDRSLRRGFYQGWDLHPAQLVSRYAATYAFYRRSLPTACARLANYLGTTTLTTTAGPGAGGYLDEPATARALAAFCLRALDCGAVTGEEITTLAGVGRADLAELTRPGADHEESR